MSDPRHPIFEAIRAARGKGFTADEVSAVAALLDRLGLPRNGERDIGPLVAAVAAGGADIGAIVDACRRYFPEYGMTTAPRIAEFLAQIANETGGFKVFHENLNYSAEALVKTWPSRFNAQTAAQYARKPEMIANKVYGDRMGNTAPGDGWKYRGRGALQLTGKANYAAFGAALGLDLVGNPDLAADPGTSVRIALEFFKRGGVNAAVDARDFAKARRITNGGSIGLAHVAELRAKLLGMMA